MTLEDTLAKLHEKLALELLARLEDPQNPPTAAELNVVRQFLKDQGVDSADYRKTPVFNLAERLPFVDPDKAPGSAPTGT